MANKTKIWISLGQGQGNPHYYALNEADLKTYLDHLNSIGFNAFSYDEDKARGFIQEFEIAEKRLHNITKDALCYLWLNSDLSGWKACNVVAISDTMNDVATQVSNYWNHKVTKKHLLTQYSVNPEYIVRDIQDWNVKEFVQTKIYQFKL